MKENELEEGEAGCFQNDGDDSTIDPDIALSYINKLNVAFKALEVAIAVGNIAGTVYNLMNPDSASVIAIEKCTFSTMVGRSRSMLL
ncbi:Hypothetical predicted protein [Olea europaea subsp. europaea]|uniref:Uncharacterized protein n=1 Tax=Olea europaea subsp. europaea TaxID=158383 RepID=A0A8S0SCF0_OLEEU|nr:Hypothetical predicted protein [Olea europaea subsp. europaea]